MIAIIPAAGKGTRMMSVTGGTPKELLKLGSRTVLSKVIEEARDAEVDGVCVVNSRSKPEVDAAVSEWSHSEFADLPLSIQYQEEARGLGHAVASAKAADDALVMVGDVVYQGGSPSARMCSLIFRGIDGCVAVQTVSEEQMHLYGIVEIDENMGSIVRILEKPNPSQTDSRWAVAGRWAFSKLAMKFLADYTADPARLADPREINLTEIINLAISQGMDFKAVALQPDQLRVDCGSEEEYMQARRLRWE